ncbi:hypothetical protein [Sutcliffiella deserti]|uniref:hypothetical protein n=1 Tax=Sutcliffiella deserti TaxID=2875501 RepID=UPI001CBA8097|nr:hypothetical protein [Sutcliffiella deserti]
MLKKIKEVWGKWFNLNKQAEGEAMKPEREYKTIQRIEELKKELNQLIVGYDKSLESVTSQYNEANSAYEQAYQELTNIEDYDSTVKPLEDAVREFGFELDTINQYKKEDVAGIVNEINYLQDKYVAEVAGSISRQAEKVQELKKQYLQQVEAIGADCNVLIDTENFLVHHSDYSYKPVLVDKLALLTKDAPVKAANLEIDAGEVQKALSNG